VRGVESAAAINAVVTVCKLVPLAAFALMAALSFKVGVFNEAIITGLNNVEALMNDHAGTHIIAG